MLSFDRKDLVKPSLPERFSGVGQATTEPIEKGGKIVTYLYWRIGYDYLG